jgi:sucrose-phosphate synthase
VCGDSGKDEEMIRGDTCGVVVGHDDRELEHLKGLRKIYFSGREHAAGILDGLSHYGFSAGEGE